NAYVTGEARSANFPTTSGAWQTASGGGDDAVVVKLHPRSAAIVYSSMLGGGTYDNVVGVVLNTLVGACETGCTSSANFLFTPPPPRPSRPPSAPAAPTRS